MAVYIIKFSRPLKHARYYVGYCADGRANERLEEHRAGRGAKICAAAVRAGITLSIVAVLPGYRDEELRIKQRKSTPKYVEQLKRQGVIK